MKKLRKRILGAIILFLMIILAIGTMVTFAEERNSSYSLTIKKVFADNMTDEARTAAENLTYNFRVEAQVKKSGEDAYVPVVQNVEIPDADGNWEVDVPFGSSFKISVIEQTDNGEGNEYDVVETVCESSMHVSASQATVNISKTGGMIKVTRPADVPTVTFELTGKPFHEDHPFTFQTQTATVEAGKTAVFDNLPQGQYTIKKLRSADGFSVLVGKREFPVAAGGTGTVHINGSDSKLTIKAPTPADGTVRTHHYHISGPVSRDIDVQSGQVGTVEHLTEGTYEIKVSETYSGVKGYTVEFPVLTATDWSGSSSALTYDSAGTRSYKSFSLKNAKYVEFYGFGPLYDGSNKKMSSSVTYKLNYGVVEPGQTLITRYPINGTYVGDGIYTLNKPVKLVPGDNRLYFAITNVSDEAAKKLKVKWREYTETGRKKEITKPSAAGDIVEIADSGWITLSKATDSDPLGSQVSYYYTITDSNGANIAGIDGVTVNGTPIKDSIDEKSRLMLRAGKSIKIEGLHKGYFRIKEEVESVAPMGFTVRLEDTEKTVTTPGGSIEIEILDTRAVNISRRGDPADDGNRVYTYNIYRNWENTPVNETPISLHSGETTTVAANTGSMLPAGKYRIKAMDDQIVGFDVAFSDSSSLVSDYIKNATVTFTNRIDKVQASYHVIHEYYLKNADGSYKFEGTSPVYTKNCDGNHNDRLGHYSNEVHLQDVHDGRTYTHIENDGDAYGKVVSWVTGDVAKEVPLEGGDALYEGLYMNDWRGSNEDGTYQYAYKPLTNLTYATALPHSEADKQGAQIIILRYVREETPEERGKYNVIHVYYRRTDDRGDVWEGTSGVQEVDVGRLTNENRYKTYDANGVERKPLFKPENENVEYSYVYDGAAYGRIVKSNTTDKYPGTGAVGEGWEYQKDDTMTNVKATGEGDQIIVLRYYRGGGYKVVHEYYYREKANSAEDSGESGEESGGTPEGGTDLPEGDTTRSGENGVSGNDPTGNVETASGGVLTSKNNAGGAEDPAGEIETLSARTGSGAGESDVSGNDPSDSPNSGEDALQGGENDVSGNNPPGNGGGSDTSAGSTGTASQDVSDGELEIAAYSNEIQTRDGEGEDFKGTLTDSDGYTYEFEGKRDIVPYADKLESRHYAENVKKEKIFQPIDDQQYTYVYKDAVYGYLDKATGIYKVVLYKTGVTATATEDEIIILRYIRGEGVKEPEIPPEEPDPPGGGGGGGGHDPDPTPPPVEPEIPEEPELPTELPDPNDPDSPDRITILENGVPRTYVKVWDPDILQWIYIPEEEVPLWGSVPATGDESGFGFLVVLAVGSMCGLVWLQFGSQKKKRL